MSTVPVWPERAMLDDEGQVVYTPREPLTIGVRREWLLTANQRLHWRPKAERTRILRAVARSEAGLETPFPYRVRLVVTVAYPPRVRRRDAMNLAPTLKALVDGLVDAHWLVDDSDQYLEGPDLRPSTERCAPDLACSLTFEFQEAS